MRREVRLTDNYSLLISDSSVDVLCNGFPVDCCHIDELPRIIIQLHTKEMNDEYTRLRQSKES